MSPASSRQADAGLQQQISIDVSNHVIEAERTVVRANDLQLQHLLSAGRTSASQALGLEHPPLRALEERAVELHAGVPPLHVEGDDLRPAPPRGEWVHVGGLHARAARVASPQVLRAVRDEVRECDREVFREPSLRDIDQRVQRVRDLCTLSRQDVYW